VPAVGTPLSRIHAIDPTDIEETLACPR